MKDKILKLRSEGLKYSEISKIIGCSKSTVSYYCGDNQREKKNLRQNIRRKKIKVFVSDYKSDKKCKVCGEGRYWVLEFHHKDKNSKYDSISNLVREGRLNKVLEEIDKCEILCSNCHKDVHYKNKNIGM